MEKREEVPVKYSRLKRSKKIKGYEGINIICYEKTDKPIDIGPGACYMRAVGSEHYTKRFFKVKQAKGEWNLLVREINPLAEFKSVPELSLLSMEFYFV